MGKIYLQEDVQRARDFIKKYTENLIRDDIDIDIQAEKHCQYLLRIDLDLLKMYFTLDHLSEAVITKELHKIGFYCKVNIYEKRSILSEFIKRTLIKLFNTNDKLINYEKLKLNEKMTYPIFFNKSVDSGPIALTKKQRFVKIKETYFDKEMANDVPYISPYIEAKDYESINQFLQENSLKAVPDFPPETSTPDPTAETGKINQKISRFETKERKVTFYDKIDDQNVILRKKKAMYLESSDPLNHSSSYKFKLASITEDIDNLETFIPDASEYENFNVTDFVNQIIFVNNGLEIPTSTEFDDISDLRNNIRGHYYFCKLFLNRSLLDLILKQDPSLSFNDAHALARESKKFLSQAALEYFYRQYLKSPKFRFCKVQTRSVIKEDKSSS